MDDIVIVDYDECLKNGNNLPGKCKDGHACERCYEIEYEKKYEEAREKYTFNIESGFMLIVDSMDYPAYTSPENYVILAMEPGKWKLHKITKVLKIDGFNDETITSLKLRKIMGPREFHRHHIEKIKVGKVLVSSRKVVVCDLDLCKKSEDEELLYTKLSEMVTKEGNQFGCFELGCTSNMLEDAMCSVYVCKIGDNITEICITCVNPEF